MICPKCNRLKLHAEEDSGIGYDLDYDYTYADGEKIKIPRITEKRKHECRSKE